MRNFKLSYDKSLCTTQAHSWFYLIITFYDHKSKEYGFCKTKMFRDDIVQVLTSGRSLQENMPTYQTICPLKKYKNQKIKTVRGDSSFFSFLFFYSLPQFEKNL